MPLAEYLKSFMVTGIQSVVDLGCGWRGSNDVIGHISVRVGVEWSAANLEKSKKYYTQSFCMDVRKWMADPSIEHKADLYIMIDFLEHLPKADGMKLLKEIEGYAQKQVLIFIPDGYCPAVPSEEPGWGHDSEWTHDEFIKLGYTTHVTEKFHMGEFAAMVVHKEK